MATLTGELISETYDSLLKVTDNNTITGIKKRITDGFGNDIPLLLSSTDLEIDGTLILSALTDLAPASKFLSLKADNTVGFRTSSELLSDIGGASSASISGTTGRLSKFTSSGAVGNSILNEIGNAIHLTDGTSSYASFGINNPGIDNDAYIGSTINNDFLIKVNNTEALRIDTAFRLKIANIQNALGDTDKFLVSEDGVVKYRTGDELRSDIGAGVGSVTSVGLTMPVAFSVANSPITSAGTLEVSAVGTASQYIRGDGQLATLPTGAGGGSAVNYYLNGSVASGVAGYQQMDNTAIIGTGTDFTLTGNGLIAQFLTDAGNPNRLLIPGGAWNLEMFFQISSSGGNAKFYVDLFKYDGTTFTSIASGITTPEEITGGTSIDLYLTSLGVPETALLITDRLAIRVYIVDNSGGRTVTLHTEDNTLCQVTTTFAGGISALNGLTANTQYFAVGTSGTDFNISSLSDTHTFNLPTASATNRGALSASDWSTFNNKQNAGSYVTLDTTQTITGTKTFQATTTFNTVGAKAIIAVSDTNIGVDAVSSTSIAVKATSGSGKAIVAESTSDIAAQLTSNTGLALSVTSLSNDIAKFFGASFALKASISQAGNITGNSFIKSGGTSSQFLKADGSVDSSIYALDSSVVKLAGSQTITGAKTFVTSGLGESVNIQNNGSGYGLKVQSGSAFFQDDVIIQGFLKSPSFTYTLPSATGILALTSDITSAISGTTNYIPKFTGANTIGNSNLINDASGNLGLGVTPSAWNSAIKSFDIKNGSLLAGTNSIEVTTNSYYDTDWKYKSNGQASRYGQSGDGSHAWLNAPSGTAGNAITFTQAMTLFSDGNLLLTNGTVSNAGYKLDVNGTGRFAGALRSANLIVDGANNGNVSKINWTRTDYSWSINNETNLRFYVSLGNTLSPTTQVLEIASTGAATFSSSVTATAFIPTSDIRLKNLTDYDYNVELIKPITYTWKDGQDKRKKIGYSAQQIKEILPEVVNTDEKGMLSVDYNQIFVAKINMLENMIQELNAKITQLENK